MIQFLKKRTRNVVRRVVNMTPEQRLIVSGLVSSGMLLLVAHLYVREHGRRIDDVKSFNEAWEELFSESTVFLKQSDLNAILNGTPHEFEFENGEVLYLVNDK